jgi:DNA helicase-2/ATP-dependent DNA helicase PcrA
LDRNYRSTQTILAAANGVIDLAKERFTKNLWTERTSGAKPQLVTVRDEADQARCIVERILENRETGTLLKQQAVLFRTSSHSGSLEIELTRRNIPFVKFGGLKFLDAAHIKDMLALLRFVENPRDRVAGFRLMHLIPGVGPTSAQRVLDHMADDADPIAALALAPAPPRAGEASSVPSRIFAIRTGRPTSNGPACGTSRIWTVSTTMPRPAAPTSSSLSKSQAATPRANAFSLS